MIGLFGPLPLEQPRVHYVVSLSSGVSSAVAADRVLQRYGADRVSLVFMDTLWEDEDNYRFLADLERHWQHPITRLTDGRTPLDVATDEHIIPNQKIAPCTRRLKIDLFLGYLENLQPQYDRVVVVLGMDWKETHRMEAPRKNYGERGFDVIYPLMWKPYDLDMFATVRGWGIEPPRMYKIGYSHANCGGRCVKQGKGDWKRTLTHFPDRFNAVAEWESTMRQDERFKDYAFLRHVENGEQRAMSLREFEQTLKSNQLVLLPVAAAEDDTTFCFCNAGDPGALEDAA